MKLFHIPSIVEVLAARITDILRHENGHQFVLVTESNENFQVDAGWISKHQPQVGGFICLVENAQPFYSGPEFEQKGTYARDVPLASVTGPVPTATPVGAAADSSVGSTSESPEQNPRMGQTAPARQKPIRPKRGLAAKAAPAKAKRK